MTKAAPFPYSNFEQLPARGMARTEEAFLAAGEQLEDTMMAVRKQAEEQGYKRGYEEGKQSGLMAGKEEREQLQRAVLAIQQAIERRLLDFESRFAETLELKAKESVALAASIARKVAGDALKAFPEEQVLGTVKQCLNLLYREFRLTIHMHTDLVDVLKTRLLEIVPESQFSKYVTLHGNATIPPGDCRIEWEGGQAESNREALWKEIDGIVQQISLQPTSNDQRP